MKMNKNLRIVMLILALIGLVDSLYLTWIKLTNTTAACLPGIGNCELVNSSKYAAIGGVPVAVLGALGYITILALLLVENRRKTWGEYALLAIFGLSLIGLLFSAYLTYLEIAVIQAICPFCVISAIVMLLIFAANTTRLVRSQAIAQH